MMTSRDRVIRTLNHEPVDRAPRQLCASPGTRILRGDELDEMDFRFPSDIVPPDLRRPPGKRARGTPYEVGQYTDAWGCVWRVRQRGTTGEQTRAPLADLSDIARYRLPTELIEGVNLARVNRSCAASSRFVLVQSQARPFERLQLLHGSESTVAELSARSEPIRRLLDMLHEFFCREMELWASSDVDGVAFCDDWGSATGLLLPKRVWRSLFKPLYRDYCEILHLKDKFAFFHSHGNILEIFGDLIEVGIDAIDCQVFLMGLQRLARRYRGQITFWGGLDHENALRCGTPEEVRAAVDQFRRAFDHGSGGVIAQCTWEPEMPFENVAALFEHWVAPVPRAAEQNHVLP